MYHAIDSDTVFSFDRQAAGIRNGRRQLVGAYVVVSFQVRSILSVEQANLGFTAACDASAAGDPIEFGMEPVRQFPHLFLVSRVKKYL